MYFYMHTNACSQVREYAFYGLDWNDGMPPFDKES